MSEVINNVSITEAVNVHIYQPPIVAFGFEKVSYEQFKKDMADEYPYFADPEHEEELKGYYDNIKLPTRSTEDASGYDFYSPIPFLMKPGTTVKIPTGIRVDIHSDWWLKMLPRSGAGFKYQVHLANTIGNIDADYYRGDNEGHIMVKLVFPHDHPFDYTFQRVELFGKIINTDLPQSFDVKQGERFVQGVFSQYGITADDWKTEKKKRTGGMGSSGKF